VTIFAQNKFGALQLLLDPHEDRITDHVSSQRKGDHFIAISLPDARCPLLVHLLEGGNVTGDVAMTSGSEEAFQAPVLVSMIRDFFD
jgi:hypothetical protein